MTKSVIEKHIVKTSTDQDFFLKFQSQVGEIFPNVVDGR
jgi:hypothetical protein